MALDPQAKGELGKYVLAAQKAVYEPKRAQMLLQMMEAPGGAVMAAHTVVEGLNKLRPVPPDLIPRLTAATYLILMDIQRSVTGEEPETEVMQKDLAQIMSGQEQVPPEGDQGMLAQMAEPGDDSEVGDGPGNDNTPMHENAEAPAVEQQEGAEEDTEPEEETGMLARMRRGG